MASTAMWSAGTPAVIDPVKAASPMATVTTRSTTKGERMDSLRDTMATRWGADGERHPEASAADGQPDAEEAGDGQCGDGPGHRRDRHAIDAAGLEHCGDDGGPGGSGRRGSCDGSSSSGTAASTWESLGLALP